MLLDYLDKVREKPLHARKRFAFMVSAVVTGVIATAWAFTLPARLSALNIEGDDMMGSASMEELDEQIDANKQGLQELIDTTQQLPDYVSPEVRAQLEAQGYLGAGSPQNGGEPALDVEDIPKQQPVLITTTSTPTIAP